MPYTPDAYDNTNPVGSTTPAKEAAPEFRAIKTVLIDHRDRIVANEADIEALQEGTPFSARYELHTSGSGNFTVPANVTKLKVTMRGPGVNGFTMFHGTFGVNGSLWSRGKLMPANGELQTYVVTVTPGDIIAYVVGSNESYSIGQTATTPTRTAAVETSFGSSSLPVPDSVYTGVVGTGVIAGYTVIATHTGEAVVSTAASGSAIIYEAQLKDTAIKAYNALNSFTLTQIPVLSPFILIEW